MRKFKVRVYREGSWFRKWVEDFEVEANEVFTSASNDAVDFYKFNNGNTKGCDGSYLVASFKANKYTVLEIK